MSYWSRIQRFSNIGFAVEALNPLTLFIVFAVLFVFFTITFYLTTKTTTRDSEICGVVVLRKSQNTPAKLSGDSRGSQKQNIYICLCGKLQLNHGSNARVRNTVVCVNSIFVVITIVFCYGARQHCFAMIFALAAVDAQFLLDLAV